MPNKPLVSLESTIHRHLDYKASHTGTSEPVCISNILTLLNRECLCSKYFHSVEVPNYSSVNVWMGLKVPFIPGLLNGTVAVMDLVVLVITSFSSSLNQTLCLCLEEP